MAILRFGNKLVRFGDKPLVNKFSNKFITVWDTTKAGVTDSRSIGIPTNGGGYNCRVEWGDSTYTDVVGTPSGNRIDHTYVTGGTYEIRISGMFPQISFGGGGDCLKLKEIKNWGNNIWRNMDNSFTGCRNMVGTYNDSPNMSAVTTTYQMFAYCNQFNKEVNFNTTSLLNSSFMFFESTSLNKPITLDTHLVTTMDYMFYSCGQLNSPITFNDTSKVTTMLNMFGLCANFNQSLSTLDTSNVTEMSYMFNGCTNFNQPVNFNTSKVTKMSSMFNPCTNFNQSLSSFDTGKVTMMNNMMQGCANFNQSINFNTQSLINGFSIFRGCTALNSPIVFSNTSNVTTMAEMFIYCNNVNPDLSSWIITGVTTMSRMFEGSNNLSTVNYDALLISWSAQSVKSNVPFHAGDAKYSVGAATTARGVLTGTYGWTITDGGQA